jgi:hypothetical protein
MCNSLVLTIPFTPGVDQTLFIAAGATEYAGAERALGPKEGAPKDDVVVGFVSLADEKTLEVLGTIVVFSSKAFVVDVVLPKMPAIAALPELIEGKNGAAAVLLSMPLELVFTDETG